MAPTAIGFALDSFGNITNQTNPALSFRFGYTGRDFDSETGLSYYRARYYDARLGRFLSEDPLGFAAGDTNLYRYVANSPTNATDPSGLILDTLVDAGFIIYDALKIKDNVFGNCDNLGENLGALGADVFGAALPFATGAGAVVKGAGHLDDAADAGRGLSHVPGGLFDPPEITYDKHGRLTNGTYTLDEPGMQPHMTGSLANGKSQFLFNVDAHKALLDAASYADYAGLWKGNK